MSKDKKPSTPPQTPKTDMPKLPPHHVGKVKNGQVPRMENPPPPPKKPS